MRAAEDNRHPNFRAGLNFGRLSLCVSLLAFVLAVLPSQALGAANHPFLRAINGSFEDLCGVAQNSGSLYVSDYYHDSVDGLSAEGKSAGQIANEDPGDGPCKIAFDASGNLYVNNWHQNVTKYSEFSAAAGVVIDSDHPTGLTVDPATGNLYVAHRTFVSEYTSPVEPGEAPIKIGLGTLGAGYGIAVSDYPATDGDVYVADAADNTVKVYDPATSISSPVDVMNGEVNPQGGFKYLIDSEIAVDQATGHVFVLDAIGHGHSEHPEAVIDEFNAEGDYRGQISHGIVDAEPSGIAIEEPAGNIYVTSGNSEGSALYQFGPTAPARTLKVVTSGAGEGTITSLPVGISCGKACSAEYNEEEKITLYPNPGAHSTFSGWTVTGAEECPGDGNLHRPAQRQH